MTLNLSPNLANADLVYEKLISAHQGKSSEDSAALNARLILLLMNQIGNTQTLIATIEAAEKRPEHQPAV